MYCGDLRANYDLPTKLFMDVGRAGEVVSMDVGFEDVPQTEIVGSNVLNYLVCGSRAERSGRVIKVEHRVDYGG